MSIALKPVQTKTVAMRWPDRRPDPALNLPTPMVTWNLSSQRSVNNPSMSPELSIQAHVATLTLRRPVQANRLEPDDLQVLADHINTVNQNSEVLVLRLVATRKYFCSGFDIGQIGAARLYEPQAV